MNALMRSGLAAFGQLIETQEALKQRLHVLERDHVWTVRWRLIGILMGLDEYAGDADRHGRPRQHWHELALPARRRAPPARLLDRMGGVEDDWRAGLLRQNRQRAHVGDEGVVAERHAALGHQ